MALPRILYPPDFPDQPSVVFNTSSFASEDFPILIAPWVSGISTTAAHLSLFQIKDRHTVRLPAREVSLCVMQHLNVRERAVRDAGVLIKIVFCLCLFVLLYAIETYALI